MDSLNDLRPDAIIKTEKAAVRKLSMRYLWSLPKEERKYRQAIKASLKRGIGFMLTPEQFKAITASPCHYCGKPGPGGIDRVDSNGCYFTENCVPSCGTCNFMKRTAKYNDFLERIHKIADRH